MPHPLSHRFHDDLPTISVDDAAALVGRPDVYFLDANPAERFRAGHVPGAHHVDPADYDASALPDDRDARLVFYCSDPSCGAGAFAAARARTFGYPNVSVMRAGIRGWLAAGKPVTSSGR